MTGSKKDKDMTPENKKKLRDMLIGHEQYKQFVYFDSTNHATIGIGRNLSDRGVSLNEALTMLDDDIMYFTNRLGHNLAYFAELDDARKMVLIDMCFNLGVNGLLRFENMLKAIQKRDYYLAAKEMLDSKWSDQVKERANQLAEIMRTGQLP